MIKIRIIPGSEKSIRAAHAVTTALVAQLNGFEAPKVEAPVAEAPSPKKAAAKKAEPAPVAEAPEEAGISLTDLREAMAPKADAHREKLLAKLQEFGSKNLTNLDTKHYAEMLNFINALK